MNMLAVDIDDFQKIGIRGKKTIISYRIRVTKEDHTWFVFHTEEQILNLAKTLHKPIMEGYLLKKSVRGVPSWNKRYFRLLGNVLYYSHENNDATPHNSKTVDLLNASIAASYDIKGLVAGFFSKNVLSDGKGLFEIQVPNQRTVFLKAPNQAEMVKWITELNMASKPERRRRFTAPMLLVRSSPKMNESSTYSDQELVKKRTDLNTFLKKLVECYQDSEILHSFLLVAKYAHVRYPQMKMMVEAMQTDLAVIKKLHEDYGVPLNFSSEGIPFISKACRKGSFELVKYILTSETELSARALVNKLDQSGNSPLYYACESASLEIAHLLISYDAKSPLPDFGLWTPLHNLALRANPMLEEHVSYLEEIVRHLGTIINVKDAQNQTALHVCAKEGNAIMAIFLLKHKADHTLPDLTGKSFLHILASNGSKKAHNMMKRVLEYMFQTVNSLPLYDNRMVLLDMRDNEGKTAVQYAQEIPECAPHANLLQTHYLKLEDLRFSIAFSDLVWKYNNKSKKEEINDTFHGLVEFLCIACSVNDYHSDTMQLIKRSIDFRERASQELHKSRIPEAEIEAYKKKLMEGIYPIIYTHFLKKKVLLDSIMNKCMLMYRQHATFRSFGIEEDFWNKIQSIGRETEASEEDPEPPLVREALKILTSMPTKYLPQEKFQCLESIFRLFDSEEIGNRLSILTYLLVRASDERTGLPWSAEIDYITTFSHIDCSLLELVRMFFLTSWMHKKSGSYFVESVDSLEKSTVLDIKCLWSDIRKDKKEYLDIELLHTLFFECAHTKISKSPITLPRMFFEKTMANHFMKEIMERLQLKITPDPITHTCTVEHGDFVDCSVFARIASSFAELPLDVSVI